MREESKTDQVLVQGTKRNKEQEKGRKSEKRILGESAEHYTKTE